MKTIEEAAKEAYQRDIIMSDCRLFDIRNAHMAGFSRGVQFAKRWIPIEEELPKTDDHSDPIEMELENGVIVSGYRFSDGDWLQNDEFGHGKIIKTKVTRWRPIELK